MFIEKASTRLAVRPKLEELRALLSEGDTVVVTKADRIAQSTPDLLQIVESFDKAGVKLEILTGAFNRDSSWDKALFGVQAVFAELERNLIRKRTMEGLQAARARGRTGGRKPKLSDKQAAQLRKMYAAKGDDRGRAGRDVRHHQGVRLQVREADRVTLHKGAGSPEPGSLAYWLEQVIDLHLTGGMPSHLVVFASQKADPHHHGLRPAARGAWSPE